MPVGQITLSASGTIRAINHVALKFLGIRRDEVLGRSFKRHIAREHRQAFSEQTALFWQRKRGVLRVELQLENSRTRRLRWVEFVSWVCRSPEGTSPVLEALLLDNTRQKEVESELRSSLAGLAQQVETHMRASDAANAALQAEMNEREQTEVALRESEDCFRLMVEGIEDYAIFMLNAQGRVATWNRGAQRIKGYQEEEIVGRHFSWFYPAEDVRLGKPDRLLRLARERGWIRDEGWRVRRDGSRFWASALITAIRGPTGELRGFAKVTRDITERRQAQEALQASARNLNDFFEQAPMAFLWVEPGGHLQRINAAAQALLGCGRTGLERQQLADYFVDRGQAQLLLGQLAGAGELHQERAQIRRRDGSIRHVLVDANGMWIGGRMVYSRWFVRDITRRVQLEREVLDIAEREQRRIGQDLHDDLCQQLTCIQFLSQSLSTHLRRHAEAEAPRAETIARMVRQAIGHTRALARGLSPMQSDRFGLLGALKHLTGMTQELCGVHCRFSSNLPIIDVDPQTSIHLYRIAQEAINNAVRHGKPARIQVNLKQGQGRLTLTIGDNGKGMPHSRRIRKGMGLKVMQYRAGVIGGALLVHPNDRGGTKVVCTVPDNALKPQRKESP